MTPRDRTWAPRLLPTSAVAAAFALVLGSASLAVTPARADTDASYTATGSASGASLVLKNAAIPVLGAVEASGPTAQATLDSLDQSTAFASFPYPGEQQVGLPALVGSLFGLPIPAYPAYVSTNFGRAPASKELPGISLRVASAHESSSADAEAGGNGAARAGAHVLNQLQGDGGVSSTSTTNADLVEVSGLVRLSGVRTAATATRTASGQLTRASDLRIGSIVVPGLAFTLPPTLNACPVSQVPIPGVPPFPCPDGSNATPLPAELAGSTINAPDIGFANGSFLLSVPGVDDQTFVVPFQTMAQAMKAAGVDATYQAARNLTDGIISESLVFHTVLPAPPVPIPDNPALGTPGPTDTTLTVGQASAVVSYQVFASGALAGSPTGAAPAASLDAAGLGDVAGLGLSPGGPGAIPGSVPGLDLVTAGPGSAATLAGGGRPLSSAGDVYLVFVVIAALTLGAAQAIRIVGVRR